VSSPLQTHPGAAYASARQAYADQSVLTASPEQLVVMLYDGAVRFLTQAASALRGGETSLANERLGRAQAIVDELNGSLDMSHGELPERLRSIYLFSKRTLFEARIERDPLKVETVVGLLSELRESWDRLARASASRA